jgi:beta-N-acetylhexosaminidase
MTLNDKVGQMIMPTYAAGTADSLVTSNRVGGFVFLGNNNTASGILTATNHLQDITSVPLLFSIDCEAGLGARVTNATRFPLNMGSAAARRKDLAREQGKVTARECRAVGVHIGFGPVLDVNTEPVNPIIGVRSYSDNPGLVAKTAEAYVEGVNSEGLLSTYKHFPGHGSTTGDSHSSLPVVDIPCDALQSVHVAPYAHLIGQGTGDLVMTAHVWYQCLDPGTTAWPATLSTNALTGILRTQLAYDGTVISDAFSMAGLTQAASTYDAARIGVLAGLDIILTPSSVTDAINGLKDAVNGGQIPMARIDASVRRILKLKSRVGMPELTTVSTAVMNATVGHPDHFAVSRRIGQRAICQALVQQNDFPLSASQRVLCLSLDASSTIFYLYSGSFFLDAMYGCGANVTTQTVSTSVSSSQRAAIIANAQTFDRVVVTSREWKPTISSNQVSLVQGLINAGVRMAYCSFGSPYQINQFTGMKNYYCGFSSHFETQREMAKVLTGLAAPQGLWPVTVAGVTPVPPPADLTDAGIADWELLSR